MNMEIKSACLDEKLIIANLIELYKYDLSEFELTDLNERGEYDYKYLPN
jgi:hypothetical protein